MLTYFNKPKKKMRNDLIDIIHLNVIQTYKNYEAINAIRTLQMLSADCCIALQNTLDTINEITQFPSQQKTYCCIGYVNQNDLIAKANIRADICRRIASGQISFGILVFDDTTCNIGSKTWVNRHLGRLIRMGEPHNFIDNCEEHVISVQSVGGRATHLTDQNNLIELVEKGLNNNA